MQKCAFRRPGPFPGRNDPHESWALLAAKGRAAPPREQRVANIFVRPWFGFARSGSQLNGACVPKQAALENARHGSVCGSLRQLQDLG